MPTLTMPAASSASVAEPLPITCAMTHLPVLRIELAQGCQRLANDAQSVLVQRQERTARIAARQAELVERGLEYRLARAETSGVVRVEPGTHQELVALAQLACARQVVLPDCIEIVRQLAAE